MSATHTWNFFRAGGFDQVVLQSGADIANLPQLDQKLWVALACPTSGVDLDPRFLELVDVDGDKRIRAPELLEAVRFVSTALTNMDDLLKEADALPLSAINTKTPEGKVLLRAARQLLQNLGKKGADSISVADVQDPMTIFADAPFNGDGIINDASTTDAELKTVIANIVDCLGPEIDRSGEPGADQKKIETFYAEVDAAHSWHEEASKDAKNILPLGEATTDAVAAYLAIRAKVDDYFARCNLAAFDPRVGGMLNRAEAEYSELVTKDLQLRGTETAHFPLAQIAAGKPLPLRGAVNPAYLVALEKLNETLITPQLGEKRELTEADWAKLRERLAGHLAWIERKRGAAVEKLGAARIAALKKAEHKAALLELVDKDKALEAEAKSLQDVERLVRYYRNLYKLCTNFVNFRDFYDADSLAIFQCGTLYIDQRACMLCIRVDDPAKHAALAGLAGAYLAYVDCVRPATNEKIQVVAVVTDGNSDNLMVGRNGLFYDRHGKDYDATIVKIIDNPISLRQAFFSPYKKLVRLIEEQVAKRASAADTDADSKLNEAATQVTTADQAAPAKKSKPVDVGTVAALGVAVAGIGTFFTAFVGYATGIMQMGLVATIAAFLGLILMISLPALIMAYIKLRKRNLGPLLDASGWAINSQAKLSVRFGSTLTSLSQLPDGAQRTISDAYADQGIPWKRWVFVLLVIYAGYKWTQGTFDRFLPERFSSRQWSALFAPPPAPAAPAPATSAGP